MIIDRKALLTWWTACLLLAVIGMAIYLTAYVWRRVDRKQNDADVAVVMNKADFSYFYAAAKAMREGRDIYTEQAPGRGRAGYIYPPLIAFLYQPLTLLDINTAARVSLLINLAAMIAALGFISRTLVVRILAIRDWRVVVAVAVLAAILSFDKIKGETQMLQTNAFVALAMALGLWFLDGKRSGWVWAGAVLGFAINVKYQALALLLYLIFRRRWKATGATVVWTVFWGLLPALSVGLKQELNYLVRGFAGVARILGINVDAGVANVEPLRNSMSISIPSGLARMLDSAAESSTPMVVAGLIGIGWLILLWLLYRARSVPAFLWPREKEQGTAPWLALTAVEWVAVIATVLAFSPQTNTRHMMLTTFVVALALTLTLKFPGKERWMAWAAIALLWAGLNLPPGRRGENSAYGSVGSWHAISGPSWTLLLATALLVWVGLKCYRSFRGQPRAGNGKLKSACITPTYPLRAFQF